MFRASFVVSPIRFGPTGRQLFGLFQAPPIDTARAHSVLICNPLGQEYVRCHRLLRVLADRLARDGFHVLRFDFFGTGDSDGDDSDGDLSQWQEDVLLAHAEVATLSGNTTTSWLGLRLGGSIAAAASVRVAMPPSQLVLWDPIADGAAYIEELEAAHATGIEQLAHWNRETMEQVAAVSKQREVLGFPISASIRQQIVGISLSTLTSAMAQSLKIFYNKNNTDFKRLEQNPTGFATRMHLTPIETKIIWASNEAMNSAIVPAETLTGIVESLSSTS